MLESHFSPKWPTKLSGDSQPTPLPLLGTYVSPRNSRRLCQSYENPLLSLNKARNQTLISEGVHQGWGRLTSQTIPRRSLKSF